MSRRDYSSKKSHVYQTPRKSVRRDKLKREIFKKRLKILGMSAFFIGFVAGVFYLMFVSPLFAIKNIIVRDALGKGETHQQLTSFVTEILDEKLWHIPSIPRRNFFLFLESALEETILERDFTPPIEYVSVSKQWPHTLLIDFKKRVVRFRVVIVKERQDQSTVSENLSKSDKDVEIANNGSSSRQESIAEEATQDFLIDGNGFVIATAPFTEDESLKEESLPIIFLSTQRSFTQASVIMDKEALDRIFFLYTAFRPKESIRQDSFPHVDFFEVQDDLWDEVTVKMTEGYRVYFSSSYPLQTQKDNLLSTIYKIGKDKQGELKYIDMRIQGRAYACCDLSF